MSKREGEFSKALGALLEYGLKNSSSPAERISIADLEEITGLKATRLYSLAAEHKSERIDAGIPETSSDFPISLAVKVFFDRCSVAARGIHSAARDSLLEKWASPTHVSGEVFFLGPVKRGPLESLKRDLSTYAESAPELAGRIADLVVALDFYFEGHLGFAPEEEIGNLRRAVEGKPGNIVFEVNSLAHRAHLLTSGRVSQVA